MGTGEAVEPALAEHALVLVSRIHYHSGQHQLLAEKAGLRFLHRPREHGIEVTHQSIHYLVSREAIFVATQAVGMASRFYMFFKMRYDPLPE